MYNGGMRGKKASELLAALEHRTAKDLLTFRCDPDLKEALIKRIGEVSFSGFLRAAMKAYCAHTDAENLAYYSKLKPAPVQPYLDGQTRAVKGRPSWAGKIFKDNGSGEHREK
jgi:hypothetical protein